MMTDQRPVEVGVSWESVVNKWPSGEKEGWLPGKAGKPAWRVVWPVAVSVVIWPTLRTVLLSGLQAGWPQRFCIQRSFLDFRSKQTSPSRVLAAALRKSPPCATASLKTTREASGLRMG